MKEERTWTVYEHLFPNGKKYIGITSKSVEDRWRQGMGYKDQLVGKAIMEFGWNNIEHKILFENLTQSEAEEKEKVLIKQYKTQDRKYGYNIKDGGKVGTKRDKEEELDDISELNCSKSTIEQNIIFNVFDNKIPITIPLELEIEENSNSDENSLDNKVETPSFIMTTDIAFSILKNESLTANCFVVYLTLLNFRDFRNNKCSPSIPEISKRSKISITSIKRIIDKLEEQGYITINSGVKGNTNSYYFPKEWFYNLFKDDYFQKNAKRKLKQYNN